MTTNTGWAVEIVGGEADGCIVSGMQPTKALAKIDLDRERPRHVGEKLRVVRVRPTCAMGVEGLARVEE